MIKIYGMKSCPDCQAVERQVAGDDRFEVIDIGDHVRNLKAFLRLRDNSPVFDEARKMGYAGIPCFLLEDGTVTLSPEDVGLSADPTADGAPTCRIDGSGC
ncbi:MAG: glutaredoxin-related protein [Prevotella sp.]|nr:glutaredoxin-related protein [Prevotella sp.]